MYRIKINQILKNMMQLHHKYKHQYLSDYNIYMGEEAHELMKYLAENESGVIFYNFK